MSVDEIVTKSLPVLKAALMTECVHTTRPDFAVGYAGFIRPRRG